MKVVVGRQLVAKMSCRPPTFELPSEEHADGPRKNRCRPQSTELRGPRPGRAGGQLRRGARAGDGRRPAGAAARPASPTPRSRRASTADVYFNELLRLQGELVKLQDWVVAPEATRSSSCSRAATRPARAASSSASRSGSTRASAASSRCRRRTSASARSGTSSATCRTCRPAARSCCSTAAGTTAPASSA